MVLVHVGQSPNMVRSLAVIRCTVHTFKTARSVNHSSAQPRGHLDRVVGSAMASGRRGLSRYGEWSMSAPVIGLLGHCPRTARVPGASPRYRNWRRPR